MTVRASSTIKFSVGSIFLAESRGRLTRATQYLAWYWHGELLPRQKRQEGEGMKPLFWQHTSIVWHNDSSLFFGAWDEATAHREEQDSQRLSRNLGCWLGGFSAGWHRQDSPSVFMGVLWCSQETQFSLARNSCDYSWVLHVPMCVSSKQDMPWCWLAHGIWGGGLPGKGSVITQLNCRFLLFLHIAPNFLNSILYASHFP